MKMNWNVNCEMQSVVLEVEVRGLERRKPIFHQATRKETRANSHKVDESQEFGWFLKLLSEVLFHIYSPNQVSVPEVHIQGN